MLGLGVGALGFGGLVVNRAAPTQLYVQARASLDVFSGEATDSGIYPALVLGLETGIGF